MRFVSIIFVLILLISCKTDRDEESTEFVEGSQLHLLTVEDIGSIPKAMFDHDLYTVFAIVRKGKLDFSGVNDSLSFYTRIGKDTIWYSQGAWGVFRVVVDQYPMIETISSGSCTSSYYKRRLINDTEGVIVEMESYPRSDDPAFENTVRSYYVSNDQIVFSEGKYNKTNYIYSNDTLIRKVNINKENHPDPYTYDSLVKDYLYSNGNLSLIRTYQYTSGNPTIYELVFTNGIPTKEIFYHDSSDSIKLLLEYIVK